MKHITGGEVVVRALQQLGVDTVFANPSIHNLAILEAIRHDAGFKVILIRHEQNAVHAADGYARATGKLGVAIVSTGPGTANTAGGLFEAQFSSSPVLLITGQVESQYYGQGKGYIHEAEQQLSMLGTLTKRAWSVQSPLDIAEDVLAAGKLALSGRRGPTAVEIPVDFQYATLEEADIAPPLIQPLLPDSGSLKLLTDALRHAQRPLIWAGGGVIAADASEALLNFVERFRIPVITTTQGRGSIPETHELWVSAKVDREVTQLLSESDLVIAIGTRFQYYPTGVWSITPGERLVHIDTDPSMLGRVYPADIPIHADAKATLEALNNSMLEVNADSQWEHYAVSLGRASKDKSLEALGEDYPSIIQTIRTYLPDDGAVVRDSTIPAYFWGDNLLEIEKPRTSMHPTSAAIGPGLPLAIGAAIGRSALSVVIHGDGGIMLSIGELAVIAESEVPLIVLVFNDRGYGILKGIQESTFNTGNEFVELHTPDFVALAESMGIPAYFADSSDSFDEVFQRAVREGKGCLIEVDVNALAPMNIEIGGQDFVSKRHLEAKPR